MAQTHRIALPLLDAAQAQKDVTHNEALIRIDALVQPVVQGALYAPPAEPVEGACWIVRAPGSGAWAGQDHAIAAWSTAGWRFMTPQPGWSVWDAGIGRSLRYQGAGWRASGDGGDGIFLNDQQLIGPRGDAVAIPSGGATVDVEARAAISAILARLQAHGLIA